MRTVPWSGSYSRDTRWVIVVLPAPDGPTSAVSCPGGAGKRHVAQHRLGAARLLGHRQRDRLQRGQRHLAGPRVAERHVVEVDRPGRRLAARRALARSGDRAGLLLDQRLQVEHLEDPVEADQRGHHVHLHVGQRGDRPVEPGQQRGQRDQRAELEGVVDDQGPAHPVDHRGGHRGEQGQRDEQRAAVHRGDHADVADPGGPVAEHLGLLLRLPEQLDQHRAGHVEPLGHGRAHRRVQLHRLPGQPLQPPADQPGRDHEQPGSSPA